MRYFLAGGGFDFNAVGSLFMLLLFPYIFLLVRELQIVLFSLDSCLVYTGT